MWGARIIGTWAPTRGASTGALNRGLGAPRGAPTRICELASDAVIIFIRIFSQFNDLRYVSQVV
jgi:hypothetical protein